MDSLDGIKQDLESFAAARDWHRFHTPRNLLLALVGEVGELAAEVQWIEDSEVDGWLRDERAHARLEEEMADVFLYLVRLADAVDVDLINAAKAKLAKNEVRFPRTVAVGESARDD